MLPVRSAVSKQEQLDLLRELLVDKIYRLSPTLIRNDRAAARVVVGYLARLSMDWDGENIAFQEEMYESKVKYGDILGLSEGTVRKYISELWRENRFNLNVRID